VPAADMVTGKSECDREKRETSELTELDSVGSITFEHVDE